MISLMLGDSNIMKMKDSLEIINAICNENVRFFPLFFSKLLKMAHFAGK